MVVLILMALTVADLSPQTPSCLTKLDPCCQNCLQRYRVCDWRHHSLQKDANCLRYAELCMNHCQNLETPEQQGQQPKVPPIDSGQQ